METCSSASLHKMLLLIGEAFGGKHFKTKILIQFFFLTVGSYSVLFLNSVYHI